MDSDVINLCEHVHIDTEEDRHCLQELYKTKSLKQGEEKIKI